MITDNFRQTGRVEVDLIVHHNSFSVSNALRSEVSLVWGWATLVLEDHCPAVFNSIPQMCLLEMKLNSVGQWPFMTGVGHPCNRCIV